MTEFDRIRIRLKLDSDLAKELVEEGQGSYYIADDRGLDPGLTAVAINTAGSVAAVVIVELSKATFKTLTSVIKRHRRHDGEEVEVTAKSADGRAADEVADMVILDEDGTNLYEAVRRLTQPHGLAP